jgi:branched-chain amino acid transport system permease protein
LNAVTQQRSLPSRAGFAGAWATMVWPWLLALAIILILPFIFTSGHDIVLMSQMGVMIVFALSYNMLLGNTGLLSFGHAVYFGLGGFIAMHMLQLMNRTGFGLPIELLPLVGAFAGLFFGIIFGAVSTRRAGVVFAMISLGIMELTRSSSLMFTGFFGGEAGLFANREDAASLFGIEYGRDLSVYYLVAVWGLLATLAMYLLRKTPLGWMANAVRDNPERAQFVGYNPQMVRFLQFCLAAFFAGLAGGMFVLIEEIITDEAVGPILSGKVLLSAYVGGIGVFIGPVIGAGLITYLENALAFVTDAWMLYFGLLFIGVVMFAPQGLVGITLMQYAAIRAGHWKGSTLARLYGAACILLVLAGMIAVIEMAFHVLHSWDPSSPMSVFRISLVATNVLPWIVAVGVIAAGLGAFIGHARPMYRRAIGGAGGH